MMQILLRNLYNMANYIKGTGNILICYQYLFCMSLAEMPAPSVVMPSLAFSSCAFFNNIDNKQYYSTYPNNYPYVDCKTLLRCVL